MTVVSVPYEMEKGLCHGGAIGRSEHMCERLDAPGRAELPYVSIVPLIPFVQFCLNGFPGTMVTVATNFLPFVHAWLVSRPLLL